MPFLFALKLPQTLMPKASKRGERLRIKINGLFITEGYILTEP